MKNVLVIELFAKMTQIYNVFLSLLLPNLETINKGVLMHFKHVIKVGGADIFPTLNPNMYQVGT